MGQVAGIGLPARRRGIGLQLRGQFIHQGRHAPHIAQLAQLVAQIRQIEGFSLADLLGELLRLFLIDLALHLLDQRQDIAHPQDA